MRRVQSLWWMVFASLPAVAGAEPLTLDQAVKAGLEQTRGVISARADVLLADVEAMRALSFILPSFDVQLTAGENYAGDPIVEQPIPGGPVQDLTFPSYHNAQIALRLTGRQLLYDGGRWWLVIARADDLKAQQQAALAAVENDTRLAVARRFWELEKAEQSADTFAHQIEIDQAQLERSKALLAAGAGKINDVAQVERNLAEDKIQLARREQAVRAAMRALNLAMGRAANTKIELVGAEGEIATLSLPPRDDLVSTALAKRPELTQSRAALEAAAKDVSIARADYYPIVNLGASYSRQSRRPTRVFDDPTQNFYVGSSRVDLQACKLEYSIVSPK